MLISVKIVPGSKKDLVTKLAPARLKVEVRELAKDNRANRAALRVIAEHFGVAPSRVTIVRGHHTPQKIVLIREE